MDFDVIVEKGVGPFWMWRLSRNGKAETWGLSLSEAEAKSDADEAIEHHRQLAEADRVMGTILG